MHSATADDGLERRAVSSRRSSGSRPAEEAAGRPDKADAVLKSGGTFVDCYRYPVTSSMGAATGRVRKNGTPSPLNSGPIYPPVFTRGVSRLPATTI
jgi:hypothetical protein